MCAALLLCGRAAAAADQSAAGPVLSSSAALGCTADNLLAGRAPFTWQDLQGDAALVTDGAVAPEGAEWNAPVGVVLATPAGSLTFDLGQPMPITALFVQADANDAYKIWGSADGTPGSFKLLTDVDNVSERGHGLRSRSMEIPPETVRYLRVGEGVGDGYFSLAEFAAYCRVPVPFPPSMRAAQAPLATVASRPWYRFDWWEDKASARVEMALAVLALALLAWGHLLRRRGRTSHRRRLRDGLLILVGALSFCAYWNFFAFHFGNYTHWHEAYHYYVGAKYFDELSFDRLYECTAVADAQEPSLRRRVELRKITNLRTNVLGSTAEILRDPARCTRHFSPARWEQFRHDLAFFREKNGVRRWEDSQTDHGYNATPVWTVVGSALANLSPASDRQLWFLTRIDPFFIVGMCLMIGWAFGWRVLCVALAVFATNFPSRYMWNGGAYLRWDWLFHMTASVCLMKKGRPLLGGYLLGYAALLRVFPGFLFAGPLFAGVQQLLVQTRGRRWWRRLPPRELPGMFRRIDRGPCAVLLGGALAVATVVPVSLVFTGGTETYRLFVLNSKKHTATPLTNYMGWRTVVSYREQEAGRHLQTNRLEDPWGDWKNARLHTFAHRRWFYLLGITAFAALLYRAVRGAELWEGAALSAVLIAVVPELTSYYYAFVIVLALLWTRLPEAGLAMLSVTAATGFIDWAPTQYLPRRFPWTHLQMPTWLDEQYTAMAAVTLGGFAYILARFGTNLVERAAPADDSAAAPPRGPRRTSDRARTRR
ncbi:MAG: hypothetical protein ABJA82_15660 [Myxococcales bacterium]